MDDARKVGKHHFITPEKKASELYLYYYYILWQTLSFKFTQSSPSSFSFNRKCHTFICHQFVVYNPITMEP